MSKQKCGTAFAPRIQPGREDRAAGQSTGRSIARLTNRPIDRPTDRPSDGHGHEAGLNFKKHVAEIGRPGSSVHTGRDGPGSAPFDRDSIHFSVARPVWQARLLERGPSRGPFFGSPFVWPNVSSVHN